MKSNKEQRITLSFDTEKDKDVIALLEKLGRKKKNYIVEAINFYEAHKDFDFESVNSGVDPAFRDIALNLSMAYSRGVSVNPITSMPVIQEPVKTENTAVIEEVKKEDKTEEIYEGDPVEIDAFLDVLAEHELSEQDY